MHRFLMSLKAELPSYAIPLFLRVVRNLDITGLEDGHNHTLDLNSTFQELLKFENWT